MMLKDAPFGRTLRPLVDLEPGETLAMIPVFTRVTLYHLLKKAVPSGYIPVLVGNKNVSLMRETADVEFAD